jgi:hypothetical protein
MEDMEIFIFYFLRNIKVKVIYFYIFRSIVCFDYFLIYIFFLLFWKDK